MERLAIMEGMQFLKQGELPVLMEADSEVRVFMGLQVQQRSQEMMEGRFLDMVVVVVVVVEL